MEECKARTRKSTGRPVPPDLFPIEKPKHKAATKEESAAIGRTGDLNKLVERNYRFIWSIAAKWAAHERMLFEDLFQDACERILHRGHNFDPDKGAFTTYFTRALTNWFGNRTHYWYSGKQCPAPEPNVLVLHEALDRQDTVVLGTRCPGDSADGGHGSG